MALRSRLLRLAATMAPGSEGRLALLELVARQPFVLAEHGLAGLDEGKPITLYHGTTRSFKRFDLGKSRDELVNDFYGKGIFLTPSKRVAWKYAEANRNIGFEPDIIEDLKRLNPNAGTFLESLYRNGWPEAWKIEFARLEKELPPDQTLGEALEEYLGDVDGNDLTEIAPYILGSKVKMRGGNPMDEVFEALGGGGATGSPSWTYATLDTIGLDSNKYRPKVYTVSVTVQNPLITASPALARKARSKGFDSVVYHGRQLVDGVPEVAVYNPRDVKIQKVEVSD